MEKFIRKIKPIIIIHAASISKPIELHEKNILNETKKKLPLSSTMNIEKFKEIKLY